jgi:hypothetical protein
MRVAVEPRPSLAIGVTPRTLPGKLSLYRRAGDVFFQYSGKWVESELAPGASCTEKTARKNGTKWHFLALLARVVNADLFCQ